MSRRRRWVAIAAAAAGALILMLVSAVLVLQSSWFYGKVRTWIVSTVENSTGGRVEIGAFRLDWRLLRAEVDNFTLHGTEPPDKLPLFHAQSVAIGLKIISLFHHDFNVQYLDVAAPQFGLIIGPDGRTNIPQPKVAGSGKDPSEAILKLAIGHFNLSNGIFAIDSRGKTPFSLQGQNLNLNLLYEKAVPRYYGQISVQPLVAQFTGIARTPLSIQASISLEKNRIGIAAARVSGNGADVQLSGSLQDLTSPHLAIKYVAHITMPALAKILHTRLMDRGDMIVTGSGQWSGSDYFSSGNLHAYNLAYRSGAVNLQNIRAEGGISANAKGAFLAGLQFSGAVNGQAVTGRVENAALQGSLLNLRGIELAGVGGSFHGDGRLLDFDRFSVSGDFAGLDIKRVAAIYRPQALPWDGLASGTAQVEGSLKRTQDITAVTKATIVPAAKSAPVNGQIAASYDGRADILDLGHSTISLPNSHADFSGVLGRTLTVHLETTDLNDLLPAFGADAAALPVKLHNGDPAAPGMAPRHSGAVFDGTVKGRMDAPEISGHLDASDVSYNQDLIDSAAADIDISASGVSLRNGAIAHGTMHGQFEAKAALQDWKLEPGGAVSGTGSINNSKAADLVALIKPGAVEITGAVTATVQVSGTASDPHAVVDIAVTQGDYNGEPFDRVAAHAIYDSRTVQVTGGQFNAGGKQLTLTASYTHDPARYDTGRLQFQLASNAMPLQQIHALEERRPGVTGTFRIDANGTVDLAPPTGGRESYRIEDLHATVAALNLRLNGQSFGNANLTATSQSGGLHAHLESDFANSSIQGDGQWQLTGDYPGSAVLSFSKLNFNQLHDWMSPGAPASASFTGAAEGELRVDGSALKPETLKAELRIPKFQISPVSPIGTAAPIALANSEPIVARLANSIVTVQSAHFTGRSTDLSLTGRITLRERNQLDLRVDGHIDLGLLHEVNRDFAASGAVTANASIRGDLSSPQVNGRVQFQNAAFNITDFPNGISNATGTIAFTGDRATIQDLTGETGGGKVTLSGFATYSGGQAVFRIHAAAREVRVRKPEGVSTVANADLNFTGSSAHSMVAGTITVLRTAFNPDSDFSSLLARSAEPVQMPSAATGLLGGLNFDVQISTAPDIQVQSTLTQDVQIDANLRLRGSATNPALLGRINITQGRLLFLGTKYTIDGGSVSFYNPVKIAPVLDIDLDTKAQGVDITLTISGPADHLTLIPSSDPPFTYNEIISLLVTGRAPSSDPALLSAQSTDPTGVQQLGPTSLLGSAIATPVSGRLQRFFGVSSLRIDPTIPGVDANPGARLTMEQQVTPNITFTYITNVTTSNPQIVQVEWALSKKWSVVALREENGMTGMDFFFKKRF